MTLRDEELSDGSVRSNFVNIWATQSEEIDSLDEDCGPTKTCKNMKEITFDGFAGSGADLAATWKATLAREGKLNTSGGSIKDIVLGAANSQ